MVVLNGKDVHVVYSAVQVKDAVHYKADILDPVIQSMIGKTVPFVYNPDYNPKWSWPVPPGGRIDAFRMVGEIVKAVRSREEGSLGQSPLVNTDSAVR